MHKPHLTLLLSALFFLIPALEGNTCTNVIITKGASKDGSTLVTYAADSHYLFGELYYHPAADWKAGSLLKVYDWDSGKYLGDIDQESFFPYFDLESAFVHLADRIAQCFHNGQNRDFSVTQIFFEYYFTRDLISIHIECRFEAAGNGRFLSSHLRFTQIRFLTLSRIHSLEHIGEKLVPGGFRLSRNRTASSRSSSPDRHSQQSYTYHSAQNKIHSLHY